MAAPHPSVVTIDHRSKPRVLFCGSKLMEVDLPVGTRVIYPKKPMAGLQDFEAAVRYAVNHPLGGAQPLYAKLRPGMKVTIGIDDLSMPLPMMKTPDVRQTMLEVVLELLDDHGVTDVELIVATAFHRPMTPNEIERMVGKRIFKRFFPKRLYNHDAEKPDGLVVIGETASGMPVEINRRVVESDLLIYVNLTFVQMNGGYKSVGTGLAGYKTLRAHHNPATIRATPTYMHPPTSKLASKMEEIGKLIHSKLDVFQIESTVNNRMFDRPLDFLGKNEDELTPTEDKAMKALIKTLNFLPQTARQAIFERVPAPYEPIGVWAGEVEAVHNECLKALDRQLVVPIEGQSDIVVFPVPYISPYNVGSYLNPLLLSVMVEGYLFNLSRPKPLVKKGGTIIALHPATDWFDKEQHAPYVEFFHDILPREKDAMKLHKEYEKDFGRNPGYIQMYRTGKGYHPIHPFYMWYWGENGRQHIGRVILVGADNEYVPKILGYETAATFEDALRMARETAPEDPSITCFRVCPMMMAEVTEPAAREIAAPSSAPSSAPADPAEAK